MARQNQGRLVIYQFTSAFLQHLQYSDANCMGLVAIKVRVLRTFEKKNPHIFTVSHDNFCKNPMTFSKFFSLGKQFELVKG